MFYGAGSYQNGWREVRWFGVSGIECDSYESKRCSRGTEEIFCGTIYLLYKKQQTLVELFKQLMSPEDKVVTEPINPQFMFILPAICKNNDIDIEIRSELSSVLIPQPRFYPLITKTFQSLYNDFNIGLQDSVYQIINKIVKPKRKTETAMEV